MLTHADLMLGQRRRRWANIIPALSQCFIVAGTCLSLLYMIVRAPQQTRDIVPMLVQCWFTVYDAGPTLNQQRDNVSCLLGDLIIQVN